MHLSAAHVLYNNLNSEDCGVHLLQRIDEYMTNPASTTAHHHTVVLIKVFWPSFGGYRPQYRHAARERFSVSTTPDGDPCGIRTRKHGCLDYSDYLDGSDRTTLTVATALIAHCARCTH